MANYNFVLLRGLSRESRHWRDFKEHFQQHLPKGRVVCLDLPGTGSELQFNSPLSIPQITLHVRERFLKLRSENALPWVLVGQSLGGMVALDWLARFPKDFSAGILINTSTSNQFFWQRMKPTAIMKVLPLFWRRDLPRREQVILDVLSNTKNNDESLKQEWIEIQESARVDRSTILAQLFAASRFQAPQNVKPPLLFLQSEKDRLVSPHCGAALARKYNAEIAVHPTGGHDLPLDDSGWVIHKSLSFLKMRIETNSVSI